MENQVEKFRKTVQLLNQITEDSQRLWGVMSPQNMVEHVGGIMYANSKGIGMPIMLPPDKAAKAKARFFGSFLPFDKSVPIPGQDSNPPKLKYDSLAEAKAKALAASEVFLKAVSDDPDKPIAHAYFGEMPLSKWVEFHTLHMEHHLMQFGVLHRDEKIKALEKLIFKINKGITADTPAQWGRMNAHQMIEHIGVTFLFSTGKFNMPYTGTEENAKKMWEGFVSSDDPWKEVFPGINIGDPRPTRRDSIEESKGDMVKAFQKYMMYCIENPDGVNPHLAMGNLDIDQWRQVHVKHLKHHGRQFGLEL